MSAIPGFTPSSLSVLLPIPDLTQSHFIALVQGELRIVSMRMSFTVSLYLTLSLSALIAFLRRVLFDEGGQDTQLLALQNHNELDRVFPPRVVLRSCEFSWRCDPQHSVLCS